MAAKLLLLIALFARPAFAADPLIGSWDKDGAPASVVRADHTARIGTDEVKWVADGKILRLTYANGETETMTYAIRGNVLTVTMEGESEVYTRSAAKGAKTAKAPAEKAGSDKLSTLLLSTPWCHFRYNKISGASHQERAVFRRNGTWDSGARGETYSSGANGTVSGQSDSSSGGRWKVKGGSLFLSEGAGELEDAGLKVSRNSNGYPILNAGGKEYSSCN